MTRIYVLLTGAIVCLLAGLGVSSESILQLLNRELDERQVEAIKSGAIILKSILVIDGLLFVCAAIYFFRKPQKISNYSPAWLASSSPMPPFAQRYYRPIIFSLVLLSLVLRVPGLNTDLWMDEVFTLINTVRPNFGEILSSYNSDNQHTLYSILAKLSIGIFGEHAWSLRFPALVFGVASVWAAARVARLAFGNREAIIAASLCTFSYHHIWFSQNARGYTILLFVSLLATDCLLRGLKTGQWRYWNGYAILIAMGAFAHLMAVFVAIAHALVIAILFIRDRGQASGRWKPVAAIILSAWLTLHLYAITLPQLLGFFAQTSTVGATANVDWKNPIWLITETVQQLGFSANTGWLGLIALSLIAAWIGYQFVRRDWIFTSLAFLPAILTGMLLLYLNRNLWPRMFFHEIGFIAVFIAATFVAIGDYLKTRLATKKPILQLGLVFFPPIMLCLASALMLPKLYNFPKQDYQAARDFVEQHMATTDKVLGLHMAGHVYESYYAPNWPEVNTVDEISKWKSDSGQLWILYTLPSYIRQAKPDVASMLETDFDIVRVFPGSLNDGEIIVARSK